MKIITVIGARPQFIKAAPVTRAIQEHNREGRNPEITEIMVHTGQHYDHNMSQVFLDELEIRKPDFYLGVGSASHGKMTGLMLERIERVLQDKRPDWVLVYGDTNSTLAGALAAVKLHIPVAHVEAGLRSFNKSMPEEINRIVTDRISDLLFCPTETAVANLAAEGITKGVLNVGDVMYDAIIFYREMARRTKNLSDYAVEVGAYVLATVHRAENTDNPDSLRSILAALRAIAAQTPVVLPLHPRTRKLLKNRGEEDLLNGLNVIEPVSYLDMLLLEMNARAILTDSGGVQKEAMFHGVPCITLRDETEWVETVRSGWNHICGANQRSIMETWENLDRMTPKNISQSFFGNGHASEKIVSSLRAY